MTCNTFCNSAYVRPSVFYTVQVVCGWNGLLVCNIAEQLEVQQQFCEFKMLLHLNNYIIVFDSFLTHYKGSACMDMNCTYMLSTAIHIALYKFF